MSKSQSAAAALLALSALVVASPLALAGAQPAQPAATAPAAAPPTTAPAPGASTALELNKLETYDKGCRAYMVVNNSGDVAYQSYKLDLVLFQSDGVIGRRFALDLAPLKPQKKTVKLFELDGVACDKIGSFLINEVMECKTEAGAQSDCLQRMTTSTLTNVQISK